MLRRRRVRSAEFGVDLAAARLHDRAAGMEAAASRNARRVRCLAGQDLALGAVGRVQPWDGGQQCPEKRSRSRASAAGASTPRPFG